MPKFGYCDICYHARLTPIRFAIISGIETWFCIAHEDEAPAWAERVRYWRRKTIPDIEPGIPPYNRWVEF